VLRHHGRVPSESNAVPQRAVWGGNSWLPAVERAAVREGVRAMAPLTVAITVWGVVTGVAMVNAGLGTGASLLMTATVYAGSAQLATLPLLVVGTPLPIVWTTALLVNLRFVIFAAASRRSFVGLPFRQRLLAGYLNGDLGFALFSQRFHGATEFGTAEQHGFFYGCGVMNWLVWQVSSVAGVLIGGLAPSEWGLELAATMALVAVLVPMVTKSPALTGVAVAAVAALLTVGWPMRLGLIASVFAGVLAALGAETILDRRSAA
jgi:predicted branched-subunit amino acid permease